MNDKWNQNQVLTEIHRIRLTILRKELYDVLVIQDMAKSVMKL